ncbi:MAG: hypothetical protein NXI09_07255 [Bacteroidetes bacterium]|nr:hypothetical protein [Bacteroidota bacterium]
MKKEPQNRLLKSITTFFNKGQNRIRIAFVGLSLLLWFFIKLSKPGYVSTVYFDIDYSNLPTGLVFTEEPPQHLQIKLQGSGYNLLKYSWFNLKDLDIDLNSLDYNRQGASYWTSEKAKDYLEAQINNENTRILEVYPDTIFFQISKLSTKSIPVEVVYNSDFDSTAYTLYGRPQAQFDSLVVEAPAEVLAQLEVIKTKPIQISDPEDSLWVKAIIDKPQFAHLKISQKEIEVKFEFSPLTEGRIQVPINLVNVPDSIKVDLFPSQTEILFRCALRDYKEISVEKFSVYADYEEIKGRPDSRFLSIKAESPPSQVLSMQMQPKRVEYLLSKP